MVTGKARASEEGNGGGREGMGCGGDGEGRVSGAFMCEDGLGEGFRVCG